MNALNLNNFNQGVINDRMEFMKIQDNCSIYYSWGVFKI